MRSFIRTYEPEDRPEVLALQLREADVEELKAAVDMSCTDALASSLDASEITWVIIHDNRIEGVFGLSGGHGVGIPWLLATDKLQEFAYKFLKQSKTVIRLMLQRYTYLSNFVDSRHTAAIDWLKWLGFEFNGTAVYLHDKTVPFFQFFMDEKTREDKRQLCVIL